MKAIILAGGLGTRLAPVIGDSIPKCMALVNDRPIIDYIIEEMHNQDITDITVSLHHKADVVTQHLGESVNYKVEPMLLGTGGAIKYCIEGSEPVIVVNGDTIVPVDFQDMLDHYSYPLTIAITKEGKSAGVYILSPEIFKDFPEGVLSFEEDIIPNVPHNFYQIPWFIDIGTPEGYKEAQGD
jgi:NDP-sugar pyrophosphorylase family protein